MKEGKGKATVTKEVVKEAKVKKKIVIQKIPPPPRPEIEIGGVENPLNEGKHYKRSLCVALAIVFAKQGKPLDKGEEALRMCANVMRHVGIVKKLGFTKKNPNSDDLTRNELSGLPYAKGTALRFWKDGYAEQYADKVGICMEFAVMAVKHCYPELFKKSLK